MLATLGGTSATRAFIAGGNKPFYYQVEFGPAVLAACGFGFRNPPDVTVYPELTPLWTFLQEQAPSFECSSLPPTIAPNPLNGFQVMTRNLMEMAGWLWRVTGISWRSLDWLGGFLMGVSTAAAYLFLRTAMGSILAVCLTVLWATSPLHLAQVPHLRDYAKAPFFAVMLCAVMWAARSSSTRLGTVSAMAILGAVLGFGFGIRTDVLIYLPLIVIALFFRPNWTRTELTTRGLGAVAAVVMFFAVAMPVLRGYQEGNNLAHVAILGLTDPSRDWLRLQPAPYSYGYLYDDGYVAAIISAEAERHESRSSPVRLGSADYAFWGNEYYGRLLRAFPGDMLTRSWAAVRGGFGLPFVSIQVQRPAWSIGTAGLLFDWRGGIVERLSIIPPVATAIAAFVMLGVANLRLAILTGAIAALLAGSTAIQFQGRHIFQLEMLSWCAIGFVAATIWRFLRGRLRWESYPRAVPRAALLTLVLLAIVTVPIAAARRYQVAQVTTLFETYDSAPTEPLSYEIAPASRDSAVIARIKDVPPSHDRRFVDSGMISATFGGEQCDADVIGVTFRYYAVPPYADLSRYRQVPIPPPGSERTRIVFPIYSTGGLMTDPDALRFAGVELAKAHQSCLVDLRRVTNPDSLPVLMEAMLTSDWRKGPLYEAFQDVERKSATWHFNSYAIPEGLQPGRRWLRQVESIKDGPTFRSGQVKDLTSSRIESSGRAKDPGAYLLTWPYGTRPAGSVLIVEGEIIDGGLTIGVQQDERWVHQVNVDAPGAFRVVIRVDAPGSYGAVLANHQVDGGSHHSVISRYGWLPPQP